MDIHVYHYFILISVLVINCRSNTRTSETTNIKDLRTTEISTVTTNKYTKSISFTVDHEDNRFHDKQLSLKEDSTYTENKRDNLISSVVSTSTKNISVKEYITTVTQLEVKVILQDFTIETRFVRPSCKPWPCGTKLCSCNELCVVFGDCCFTAFEVLFGVDSDEDILTITENPFHALQQSLGFNQNQVYLTKMYIAYGTCISIKPEKYIVINKCPENYDNVFVKEKCNGSSSYDIWNIPVYINITDNVQVTFRNLFCAYCHGYNINDLFFWEASVHCPQYEENDATTMNGTECYVKTSPPLKGPQPYACPSLILRTCIEENHKKYITNLCSAFIQPIVLYGTEFKNHHCPLCYGYDQYFNKVEYGCEVTWPQRYPMDNRPQYPGLDIFFAYDRNALRTPLNDKTYEIECGDNKKFDFYTMTCKMLTVDSNVPVSKLHTENTTREFSLIIRTNRSNGRIQINPLFTEQYYYVVYTSYAVVQNVTYNLQMPCTEDANEMICRIDFNITSPTSLLNIFTYLKRLSMNKTEFIFMTLNTISSKSEIVCNNNTLVLYNSVIYSLSGDRVLAHLPFNRTIDIFQTWFSLKISDDQNTIHHLQYCDFYNNPFCTTFSTYSAEEFSMSDGILSIDGQAVHADDNYFVRNETLFLCINESYVLNCTSVTKYRYGEFSILNSTLFIQGIQSDLQVSEYTLLGKSLYVCTDKHYNDFTVINTLTDILIVVSLLSLLVTIVTHVLVPDLRNVHGRNIICLSVCLFCSQLIFFLCRRIDFRETIINILSIADHFFWLSVFSWTFSISFDITNRLLTMSGGTPLRRKENRRFRKYLYISFGVPSIGVIICGVIDYKMAEKPLGYGMDLNCWISNPDGLLYSYIIPVGSALLFSLCCFVLILVKIEKTRRSTAMVNGNRNDRIICVIYFKLFVILGLSWIIGLVSSNIDFLILSYINSAINASQGFLLAFVCLCNRRNCRRCRAKKYLAKTRGSGTTTQNNTPV